jgi:hypothetical protein
MIGTIFGKVRRRNSQSLIEAQMHFDEGVRLAAKGLYPKAVIELKARYADKSRPRRGSLGIRPCIPENGPVP